MVHQINPAVVQLGINMADQLSLQDLISSRPDLANPPALGQVPDPTKIRNVPQSPFIDQLPIPEFLKSVRHDPSQPHLQDLVKYLGDALFSPTGPDSRFTGAPANDPTAPVNPGIFGNESRLSGEAGKAVGGQVDSLLAKLGVHSGNTVQTVGEQVGQGLPRTLASSLAGPLGMISDAGAQGYGDTGSVSQAAKQAALTAGTLGLAHIGGQVGEKFVSDQLAKMLTPTADTAGQTLNRGIANEMLAGTLPKVGRAAGAVTGGVAGQELGHQIETGGSNPFTVENVAKDVFSGAMMAILEAIGMFREPNAANLQSRQRLQDYLNNEADNFYKSRGETTSQPNQFARLLKESVSNIDTDPQWRKDMVVNAVKDLGNVTDPAERAQRVSQITEGIIQSRDFGASTSQAEKDVKMAIVKPPTDAIGLSDMVRRFNGFKKDFQAQLDEMAQSPEGKGTSSAAYDQLVKGGYLKEISLDDLKEWFGNGVERSLSNSYSSGYQIMLQQAINRQLPLIEAAKTLREQNITQQSIQAPGMSSSLLEDRRITSNFVDALSKVKDPELLGQLYDRFNFHEDLDNRTNTGSAPKFMEEITDVINKVAGGQTDTSKVDWLNTPVDIPRRVRSLNNQGQETRDLVNEQVRLRDYLSKDFEGRYTKPIYGRAQGASQKEIPAGLQPPENALKATEEAQKSNGPDWNQLAHQVRGQLTSMDNESIWNQVIAPALMGQTGKTPRWDVKMRLMPMAKDLAMAVFEAGPKMEAGEGRELGESGQKVLSALGQGGATDRSQAGQLIKRLNDIFGQGGRNAEEVRKEIVKRAATLGGVMNVQQAQTSEAPQQTKVPIENMPDWLVQHLDTQVGASGGEGPYADTYRTLKMGFMNLGYEPEMVDRFVGLGLRVLDNFRNPELQIGPLDTKLAYPEANNQVKTFNDLSTAGFHGLIGDTPIIGIAAQHMAGSSQRELAAFHLNSVLLHELVHDVQNQAQDQHGLTPPTPYTRERVGAWRQLWSAAQMYTPQQRFEYLKMVADMMVPKEVLYKGDQMDPNFLGNLKYGAGLQGENPVEFVNTFAQVIGMGMITGGNRQAVSPETLFMQLPEEQALFAKGMYRDLHDNLGAIQAALPEDTAKHLTWLINRTHQMVVSTEPGESLTKATNLVNALDGKQWRGPITVLSFANSTQEVRAAMRSVQMELFGQGGEPKVEVPGVTPPPAKVPPTNQLTFKFDEDGPDARPVRVNIPLYWKTMGLVQQSLDVMSKRGLPLSGDLADVVRGFLPMQNRLSMSLWAPFLTSQGKFDPQNPLISAIHDRSIQGRRDVNEANKILEWQQDNAKSALVKDNTGNWILSDDAQKDLKLPSNFVSQRAVGGIQALQQVGHLAGNALVESRVDSISFRVARLLMAMQPKELGALPYDQAYTSAAKMVQGLLYDNQRAVTDGLTPYQQPVREAALGMLNGGLIDRLKDLKKQIDARSGWWVSEQRPGKYLLESFDANGTRHMDSAPNGRDALKLKQELEGKGFKNVSIINKAERQQAQQIDSPDRVLQNFIKVEKEAFERYLSQNPQGLTQEQLGVLRSFGPQPGEATEEVLEKRGLNRYLTHREGVPSAEGLHYADVMREYVGRLSGSISRQHLSQKIDLIMADDRMAGQDEMKVFMQNALKNMLLPTSDLERSAKAFLGGYYLAANFSSMVVNAFDAVNTLPATLIEQGAGMRQAAGHVLDAIKDVTHFSTKENVAAARQVYQQASQKLALGQKLTRDETKAYAFFSATGNQTIDKGLLEDVFEEHDKKALAAKVFGTKGNATFSDSALSSDGMYRLIRSIMILPRAMHGFNNQIGYFAGLNQAIDQGKDTNEALLHADKVRSLGLFAGGKTNMPAGMGKFGTESSIPIMRTMYTLQQYVFGYAGRWMSNMSDSVSNDPHLTSQQRVQARKALGSLVMTTLAISGILGLPGAAALMAIAHKEFGINPEEGTRKGIAHLVGADKDNTGFRGLITETAMNGSVNQLLGVNAGPRIGMSNAFGLSTYDGYNIADLLGPAPSVVENMVQGLGYLAQGQGQKGITSLAPAFLKRPVNLAWNKMKYGDYKLRDPQGQELLDPSAGQLLGYLSGFNPSQLAEKQKMRQMIADSNREFTQQESRHRDDAAQALIRGDRRPAMGWAQRQLQENPQQAMHDPTAPLKVVADRAAQLQQPTDPLSAGPVGNAQNVKAIAQTFPQRDLQRRSESSQLVDKMRLQAQMGAAPGDVAQQMSKAVMMDEFVKKGMTRPEAERLVMMLGL